MVRQADFLPFWEKLPTIALKLSIGESVPKTNFSSFMAILERMFFDVYLVNVCQTLYYNDSSGQERSIPVV